MIVKVILFVLLEGEGCAGEGEGRGDSLFLQCFSGTNLFHARLHQGSVKIRGTLRLRCRIGTLLTYLVQKASHKIKLGLLGLFNK